MGRQWLFSEAEPPLPDHCGGRTVPRTVLAFAAAIPPGERGFRVEQFSLSRGTIFRQQDSRDQSASRPIFQLQPAAMVLRRHSGQRRELASSLAIVWNTSIS